MGFRLPAVPSSVPEARHRVADYLDGTGVRLEDVSIGVTEAIGNAVVHAYDGGGSGVVEISVAMADDHVAVSVDDEGSGVTPSVKSGGLGLGLLLIASVSQSMTIAHRPRGGIRVTMRFPR